MTTGLYQYIREQAHRQDIVGDLGRWMVDNIGKRPDHDSRAFELAAREFEFCGQWTRQSALDTINQDEELARIIRLEPKLGDLISQAIQARIKKDFRREELYSQLKELASSLVGFQAQNPALATNTAYETFINAIATVLPPDVSSAHPAATIERFDLDVY